MAGDKPIIKAITPNSSTENTDIKCYLTTSCRRHFYENFDDNCYELIVIRWFRDNFVSQEDIKYYYKIVPIFVETISKEEKRDIIYNYIYDDIVDYCVEQIEQGNYVQAYNRYKNSLLILKKQIARTVFGKKLVKTIKCGI